MQKLPNFVTIGEKADFYYSIQIVLHIFYNKICFSCSKHLLLYKWPPSRILFLFFTLFICTSKFSTVIMFLVLMDRGKIKIFTWNLPLGCLF